MEEMTMKLSLLELYDLVGDGMGISFNYEELPGIVVTIGFSREEDEVESEEDEEPVEEEPDDEPNTSNAKRTEPKLH